MSAAAWVDPEMAGVVWTRTSRETPVARPALADDLECDLVIVGGGYLGLTTALQAAGNGAGVVLLEGGTVGAGASGRNGGFVVPHFPGALRPSQVERRLGPRKGAALNQLVAEGPDRVAELVRVHGIASDFRQHGWVQPGHSKAALVKVRASYEEWRALGAPVEWLDAGAVEAELGAAGYLGGWRSPKGAVLNPYAQALGLARAAEAAGVRILERSRATAILQEAPGRVLVRCAVAGGSRVVRAHAALVATNAYTEALVPDLPQSVIPVRLFHTATAPLPPEMLERILPGRGCFTDLRKSGGFGRLDVAGRLISGGAVFAAAPRVQAYGEAHARARMQELFPQLRGAPVALDSYWEGHCALTEAALPYLQRLRPDVFAVIGFSTRGVALAQNLGRVMGDLLSGRIGLDAVPLEMVDGVRKIPLQAVKTAIGRQIFPFYRLKDRLGLT